MDILMNGLGKLNVMQPMVRGEKCIKGYFR